MFKCVVGLKLVDVVMCFRGGVRRCREDNNGLCFEICRSVSFLFRYFPSF